jgi:hypothetical protein
MRFALPGVEESVATRYLIRELESASILLAEIYLTFKDDNEALNRLRFLPEDFELQISIDESTS